jgi:hypothetical protein
MSGVLRESFYAARLLQMSRSKPAVHARREGGSANNVQVTHTAATLRAQAFAIGERYGSYAGEDAQIVGFLLGAVETLASLVEELAGGKPVTQTLSDDPT